MESASESARLLKQEINQTTDSLNDLAKWKLITAAALAATALGLTTNGQHNYALLLLIPYACAYVDLHCYQHLIRIAVIARFLREHGRDKELRMYERQCDRLRTGQSGVFNLMTSAQILSSLVMSILAVGGALFFGRRDREWHPFWAACFGAVGLVLVWVLWKHYQRKDELVRTCEMRDHWPN